jgi:hypothetical protein
LNHLRRTVLQTVLLTGRFAKPSNTSNEKRPVRSNRDASPSPARSRPGASTFPVLNLAGSGAGSRRQAILDANSTFGDNTVTVTDTMTSSITGSGTSPDGGAVVPPTSRRQGGQRHNERKARLKVADNLVIRGHELAALLLGEADVQAIVNGDVELRGDLHRTLGEWDGRMQGGTIEHDAAPQRTRFRAGEPLLALRLCQGVGNLGRENIRGDQLVNVVAKVVP